MKLGMAFLIGDILKVACTLAAWAAFVWVWGQPL